MATLEVARDEAAAAAAAAQSEATRAVTYAARIAREAAKLDALEADEGNRVALTTLRGLITMNEALKQQEQQFKETCRAEQARLQASIEALEAQGVAALDLGAGGVAGVAERLATAQSKLARLRMLAARRTRELAVLQRQMDEIPSRLELAQYQRRFAELYERVGAKFRETKRFYTLYNTLDDTKLYMTKEEGLLSSIYTNFERAMASAGAMAGASATEG